MSGCNEDIAQNALDLGISDRKTSNKAVSKGKLDRDKAIPLLSMIKPTLEDQDLINTDFVVEAVVEHLPVKQSVLSIYNLTKIQSLSLTLSISINQLSQSLDNRAVAVYFLTRACDTIG